MAYKMVYSLVLDVKKNAQQIFEIISSEKQVQNSRAKYELKYDNSSLSFIVHATDATALKAILTSISMNLQIFEKVLSLKNTI